MTHPTRNVSVKRFNRHGLSLGIVVIFLSLTLLTFWDGCPSSNNGDGSDGNYSTAKTVIGYYTYWRRNFQPAAKINFTALTHIAHAFTEPDGKGNLIVPPNYLQPELNRAAHDNGVLMLMSIGGAGKSDGYPGMVSSAARRSKFIEIVKNFCQNNQYDGVDIDWEFISNALERQNFIYFIKELREVFNALSTPLLITLAAPATPYWGQWVPFEELADDFDYIAGMTYALHGAGSTFSGLNAPLFNCNQRQNSSMKEGYDYMISRQVPREKLLLGIPFYGRSFNSNNFYRTFNNTNYFSFSQVLNFINAGWATFWDSCALVPWLRSPDGQWVLTYENAESAALKCDFVNDNQLAGLIIWELSQGYLNNQGISPMLDVVERKFFPYLKKKREIP